VKNPITIIIHLVLFLTSSSSGQELLVDGAEWYYNLVRFGSPDRDINRCYIDGDTLIQGRNCLIYIQKFTNCNGRPKKNYLNKDGEQIYFFDQSDTTFKLLYDFSLEVGDTMIYETGIHSWDLRRRTHYIRIDSIKTFSANSKELKLYIVSYGHRDEDQIVFYYMNRKIIEDIGSTHNYFHFSDETGFCDDQYSDELICFSAPDYPIVNFINSDCQLIPVYDVNANFKINIYPNPFTGELYLDSSIEMTDSYIIIYDLTGNEVYRSHWNSGTTTSSIQMHEFASSCYFLTLIDTQTGQTFYSQMIIAR